MTQDADSNYMNMTFEDAKRIEGKRDSLFQSDDTGTMIGNDLFKTGETFFAKGLKIDDKNITGIEIRKSQASIQQKDAAVEAKKKMVKPKKEIERSFKKIETEQE